MTSQPTLVLRAAVFAAVVLWMQAGPVAVQALGQPRPPGTMTWRMYGTRGSDLCAVEWFTRAADGTLTPVERRGRLRRYEGEVALRRASVRLCGELGRGTDLRARARCGSREGWVRVMDLERDLCRLW